MTATSTEKERPHFTLRRCFWLCLPALIIGAILRISFLAAVPEGFYGSDSNSYFATAHAIYIDHRFEMPAKRRYIYPLLLTVAPPVPFCNTVQVVAAVQHLTGLFIIFGIGWITGHLVRRRTLWVPLVTTFAAIWPRTIYYEHELISETLLLGAFIATVAIAIPRQGLACDRRLIWFCILALLIVAIKPAGRPIWLGLILAAALVTRRPLHWPKLCYATLPLVILVALTSGKDSQGPWLFLSSALPLVKTEGEPYARERALIRPAIESARTDLSNYVFNQGHFKKMLINDDEDGPLGPAYAKLLSNRKRFAQVAQALARQAVLAHPFQYFGMVCKKIIVAAADRHAELRIDPAEFWSDQSEDGEIHWSRRPKEMQVVYEMDRPAFDSMVGERATHTVWYARYLKPFTRVNWLQAHRGEAGHAPRIHIQTMGWLALLGLVCAFLPGRFVRTSFLWLPLLLYLFIVYAIGDTVTRYLVPIEWILFIFMGFGLDTILDGLAFAWRRVRPSPADVAPVIPPTEALS